MMSNRASCQKSHYIYRGFNLIDLSENYFKNILQSHDVYIIKKSLKNIPTMSILIKYNLIQCSVNEYKGFFKMDFATLS